MSALTQITAAVRLRPAKGKRQTREYWEQHRDSFTGPDWLLESVLDPEHDAGQLELRVSLSAHEESGRCIEGGTGFGLAGPSRGLGAVWHRYHGPVLSADPDEQQRLLEESYRVGLPDIEDGINQMLGRDPTLHRPPLLAWGGLIEALAAEQIHVSEEQLIEIPLVVELDEEVLAALAAS